MKSGSTEPVFIIDRSGSMSGLEDDTIGGYNTMLKEPQAAKEAFIRLKEVMGGLKKAADELMEEFTDLIGVAQANGGKIPDVNEILRQVLSERDKEDKK